jgi:hypothetical protein
MVALSVRIICDVCHSELEWECLEGMSVDTFYIKPCRFCAEELKENLNKDS